MELRSRKIFSGHSPRDEERDQDEKVDNEGSKNGSDSEEEYIPISDSEIFTDTNADVQTSTKLVGESSSTMSSRRPNQQSDDPIEATMTEVKFEDQSDENVINSNVHSISKRKRNGWKKRD